MDKLSIVQFRTSCKLGVLSWEQMLKQSILIDYSISFNGNGTLDDLSKTFNYAEITQCIELFCQNHRFKLLETLTHQLADHLIKQFPSDHAKLTIHKPYAIANAKDINFSTTRPTNSS